MSSAVALARRVQPFLARPQSGCMQEAVRARKTRLCGGAPLMCAAATRARPDRFGLSEQAGADRRTPPGGGVGRWRPALPGSASVGVQAGGGRGGEEAPLGGGPAEVGGGDRGGARRLGAVGTGGSGSANPAGGWGEPEPGRRSLQQRGEPARS